MGPEELSRIDSICDAYEDALRSGESPSISDFLTLVGPELRPKLVVELILADLEFRFPDGEKESQKPDIEDYLSSLPDWVVDIRVAFKTWEREQEKNLGKKSNPSDDVTRVTSIEDGGLGQSQASEELEFDLVDKPPKYIGPYRIHRKLGQGGMGTVWLAEQTEPVQRMVALKVVKTGMDSDQVIARFEAERQALAMMDHPNIARVLDAGKSNEAPFFVMELVQGSPITHYCDQEQLNAKERIELFLDVCAAVQHAHHKGIIHRDIKPSNVLVSRIGDRHVVKVIDFGLAKAVARPLTEQSIHTLVGQIIGTPAYMSPEQADFQGIDIDTRSDVYSLGVLMYEMLTGVTPIGIETLKEKGLAAFQNLIRTFDTPAMSQRFDSLGDESDQHAKQRSTDRYQLRKILQGDLDIIVLKSLSKERARRYDTPAAFADDLRRFLNCEPIEARPPSRAYRLRKIYERNRGRFIAVGLLLLALIGGFIGTAIGLVRAQKAEKDALVAKDDSDRRREQAMEALEVMSSAIIDDWLLKQFVLDREQEVFLEKTIELNNNFLTTETNDPEALALVARTRRRQGGVRRMLGRPEEAEEDYLEAMRIYTELAQDQPNDDWALSAVEAKVQLAGLYGKIGEWEKSRKYNNDAKLSLQPVSKANPSDRATRLKAEIDFQIANDFVEQEKFAEAKNCFEDAVKTMRDLVSKDPKSRINRDELARYLQALAFEQRFDEGKETAVKSYIEAIQILEELRKEIPESTAYRNLLAVALNDTGIVYKVDQDYETAEGYYQQALELRKSLSLAYPGNKSYGNQYGASLLNTGNLYRIMGKLDESIEYYQTGIENNQAIVDADPAFVRGRRFLRNMHEGMAESYIAKNDFENAIKHWDASIFNNGNQFRLNEPKFEIRLTARRLYCQARLGQTTEAVKGIEQLIATEERESLQGDLFYEAACVFAAATQTNEVEAEQKETWLKRSESLLADAIEKGFVKQGPKNVFWYQDPDFQVLHQRQAYKDLLEQEKDDIESSQKN